jgi:hypothetical protein
VLKNSFRGSFARNFVCKLLNVRSPKTLRFSKITALVPFQQPRDFSPIAPISAGCPEEEQKNPGFPGIPPRAIAFDYCFGGCEPFESLAGHLPVPLPMP